MAFSFTVSAVIPASPEAIYDAWLDGKQHALMTGGGPASASKRVGGSFTAWDGYISGRNLELKPGKRILQSWRSTEFAAVDPDSTIDVTLKKTARGTRVTLRHANVPDGQDGYKTGWRDFYFAPMKSYFAGLAKAAPKRRARKPAKAARARTKKAR